MGLLLRGGEEKGREEKRRGREWMGRGSGQAPNISD